jgi:predicted DNA-binding transcriptional regulator YafY
VQHVGPDHVVASDDDGIEVELPVTNRAAFRSFVLSFLEHAEVLDPPELRADVVDWLERVS